MSVAPYLFLTGDTPLSARIYRNTHDPLERQPAVIITGSWLTVKEQMADRYARELAARGFTVFTFDFAGFGESGGTPRQAEIPARKIADITAAASFVGNLSFVAPGKVGYLAVCARVRAPVLFVHSDDCVLPDNVKALRDRLAGPAELLWADGTQTDFYDKPDQVTLAADAAADHFRRTLA
jgi:fermentation-respiration switch protein FrsA (DUF1100 family)